MTASTWIRRWFVSTRRLTPPVRHRKPKVRPSIRPRLEMLEDRLAPAVLTVNTLVDTVTDPNQLSLREALILVNVGGNPATVGLPGLPAGWTSQISGKFGINDTIQFAPSLLTQNAGFGYGVIGLTSVGDGTAGPSALAVDVPVSIVGLPNSPGITIGRPDTASGINVPNMRLFYVGPSGNLTLDNLTLRGGIAQGGNGGGDGGGGAGLGGAIFNQGTLTVQNSLLTGNTAQGGSASTGYGGGGGGLGGNGQAGEGKGATPPPIRGYGGGPNAGNPNGGPGSTNGGFGGGGAGGGVGFNSSFQFFDNAGGNGGFGGGGGGAAGANAARGGNGGFGGGGGGGVYVYHGGGSAGTSEFGGGSGATGEAFVDQFVGRGGGGAGFGGAIFNDGTGDGNHGSVTLTNTTFTGNRAVGGASPVNPGMGAGAAIFNYNGTVDVNYSTLVRNYAAQGGAEIYDLGDGQGHFANLILNDSILADSQGSSEDLHIGAINSGNAFVNGLNNLVMSESGPIFGGSVILSTADPKLGPLQYNGGPTQTMAPQPGSPVIDRGTNSAVLGVATDARGLPRIYAFPNSTKPAGGDGSDLGAVEVTPATITVNTTSDMFNTTIGTDTDPNSLSLRQAVTLAEDFAIRDNLTFAQQNLVQGDFGFATTTIRFAPSLAGQTVHLASSADPTFGPTALAITSNLTIAGPTGNQVVAIAGPGSGGNLRLFRVTPDASLTLENLTLEDGNAVGQTGGNAVSSGGGGGGSAGQGGAIFNQGQLTLVNSTLSGDTAQGGAGGRSNLYHLDGGGGGGGGLQGGGGNGYFAGGAAGAGGGAAGGAGNSNGSGGAGGVGVLGGGGGGGAGLVGGQGGAGGLGGGGGGGGASSEVFLSAPGGAAGYFGGQGGAGGLGGFFGTQGGGGGGGGAGLGGAIFNDQGNITLVNSTFSGDQALGGAGGGSSGNAGSAGQGAGGAIFNYQGLLVIANSTIAGNTAQRGGGIFDDEFQQVATPFVSLTNTIVANSSGGGADFDRSNTSGPESVGSNNLIGTNAGFEGGVVSNANPLLSTLGNHGGPTQTLALMTGSPAIDAGNDAALPFIAQAEGVATVNATDQTGNPRILGAHIDIGAVAYNPAAPTGVDIHGQPSNGIVGQPIGGPITVAVVDANGNTIPDSNQAVTLAIASGPAGAVLSGTTTVDAVSGVATFTNLTLNLPGTYTLTATGGVLTPDFSNPFTISAVKVSPPSPAAAPALEVPLLLGWFDQLLEGIETVNADGTATVTDSFLGLPLLVSTFGSSGQLESVTFLGMNVTFLFVG